jgi:hypothetical protein
MRTRHFLAVATALLAASSAFAQADVRHLIEGRGVAVNPNNLRAAFEMRLVKEGLNAPTGNFVIGWTRENAQIRISLTHPAGMNTMENVGKFSGRAVARVVINGQARETPGQVFVTVVDGRNREHPNGVDRIRVRFIRDIWGSPEGDHFFEGVVREGDILVKRTRI